MKIDQCFCTCMDYSSLVFLDISDLQSILKLHKGGFTDPPNPDFPPGFKNHPGTVSKKSRIQEISIMSELLYGTKCVFFSTFTTNKDIDLAIAFASGNHETLTSIPGNKHQVRRITIGVGTADAYKIVFHVYAYSGNKFQKTVNGEAFIGKVFIVDGPCSPDKKVLDCRFDYGLCHWRLHDKKYIWYPVPFGLNHTVAHKLEWGALAAFGGEGSLWSPLVTSVAARCFSFVYAKGATDKSFLRVWLLYRITGGADKRALLYEDVSFHKVIKKLVQINLFVPFNFQSDKSLQPKVTVINCILPYCFKRVYKILKLTSANLFRFYVGVRNISLGHGTLAC
ncbi:hypothetical protein GQR58_005735 [Nymphon striatum]|nr:hypothetical protein GQR58_005735 [Nymphon striatum]